MVHGRPSMMLERRLSPTPFDTITLRDDRSSANLASRPVSPSTNYEIGVSEERKPGTTPAFLKAEPGSPCRSNESRAARDAAAHAIFTAAIFTTMSGD
jgi:hypothetical protein